MTVEAGSLGGALGQGPQRLAVGLELGHPGLTG